MSAICLGAQGKSSLISVRPWNLRPAPSSGQINTALSNGCLSAAVKLFIGKFIPVSDSLGGQRFLNEMLMCSRCTLVNFAHTSIMEIHNYTPCVKIRSLWCCGRRWRNRRGKMLPPFCSLKVISWGITAYNRLWGVNFMSWLKLLWRSQTHKVYSQRKKGDHSDKERIKAEELQESIEKDGAKRKWHHITVLK